MDSSRVRTNSKKAVILIEGNIVDTRHGSTCLCAPESVMSRECQNSVCHRLRVCRREVMISASLYCKLEDASGSSESRRHSGGARDIELETVLFDVPRRE